MTHEIFEKLELRATQTRAAFLARTNQSTGDILLPTMVQAIDLGIAAAIHIREKISKKFPDGIDVDQAVAEHYKFFRVIFFLTPLQLEKDLIARDSAALGRSDRLLEYAKLMDKYHHICAALIEFETTPQRKRSLLAITLGETWNPPWTVLMHPEGRQRPQQYHWFSHRRTGIPSGLKFGS